METKEETKSANDKHTDPDPLKKPSESSRQRFATKMENGQVKLISREGQIIGAILNWDQGTLDKKTGNVEPLGEGKKNPSNLLGGIKIFSLYPLDYIEVFPWEWDTVDSDGNKKHHEKRMVDYIYVIPDNYYSEIIARKEGEDAAVTKDGVTLTRVRLGYLMWPKNPQRSRTGITNWVQTASSILNGQVRDLIGEYTLNELLSGRGDLGKVFLDRIITDKKEEIKNSEGDVIVSADRTFVKKELEKYGSEVLNIQILGIEYPEEIRKALSAPFIAEEERKAAVTKSLGEKEANINQGEGEKQRMIRIADGEFARAKAFANGEKAYIDNLEKKWGGEAALVIYNRSLAANSSLSVRLNEHHLSGLEDIIPSGDQLKKKLRNHLQKEDKGADKKEPPKPADK